MDLCIGDEMTKKDADLNVGHKEKAEVAPKVEKPRRIPPLNLPRYGFSLKRGIAIGSRQR
jgi:hypothetical protein